MNAQHMQNVIIVAGGKGLRAGGTIPKQFQPIGGEPVLMHTLRAFYGYNHKMRIVVVLPEGFQMQWKRLCKEYQFTIPHKLVEGGETRFHSVKNGLAEIPDGEMVGVHDAARPFVTETLIGRCFDAASKNQCGVVPVVDEPNSMRLITATGSNIIDRKKLKIVQTPQVFPSGPLKKAYETNYDPTFTDDASVAEKWGMHILLVEGEQVNIKLTTPFDLEIAGFYCQWMANR